MGRRRRVADKNIPRAWRTGVLEFIRNEGDHALGCGILCSGAGGTILDFLIDLRELRAVGEPLPVIGQRVRLPGPNKGGELWAVFYDCNPADDLPDESTRAQVLSGGVYVKWDSGVW